MTRRVPVTSIVVLAGVVVAIVAAVSGRKKRAQSPVVVLDEQTIYGDVDELSPTDASLLFDNASQRRARVVAIARTQLGATEPDQYWADVLGYVPAQSLAWCGAFALWVLRRALGVDWRWVAGRGFIYVDNAGLPLERPRLPITKTPKPGDVAYYDKPYQHHALVESVAGDQVSLIAGNTPNVSEYSEPLSKATAYYSIAPIVGEL